MNQSSQITGGRVRPKASAAFVAALVVALVGAASPAAAQDCAPPGGEASANVICGTVTNSDGSPVPSVPVGTDGGAIAFTDPNGFFIIESVPPGIHIVSVDTSALPPGSVVTPATREVTVTLDMGNPTATPNVDFEVGEEQPPSGIWGVGTGTPGYWKNHPEAWPAAGVTVGGVTYYNDRTKSPNIWDAIAKMGKVGGDKTLTMFASLISAKLNTTPPVNNPVCIAPTIALAEAWMALHPVGNPAVKASSAAWAEAQEWHQKMDDYNNGKLCAPHRD